MQTYVALLRGIMPSKPNMRNDKLRSVFEDLGFERVQTVISSGNIIFMSKEMATAKLESKIEKAFPKELGFHSTTIIRTREELRSIVAAHPFSSTPDVNSSKLNVSFLKKPLKHIPDSLPYKASDASFRVFNIDRKSLGVVIDLTKTKTPTVMAWLEEHFSKDVTTRTWKTVQRILAKMDN